MGAIVLEINLPSGSLPAVQQSPAAVAEEPSRSSSDIKSAPSSENAVCVRDLEAIAKRKVTKMTWDYYSTAAMEEETMRNNCDSFSRIRIRPRVLRDVSNIDTSVTLFGHRFASPIGISPTAMMKLAHESGEGGVGRAAASLNQVQTLSTFTTMSVEEVASAVRALPGYPFANAKRLPNLWFQLYVTEDRPKAEELVRRAEKAGYTAVVVTVDTPQLGRRLHTLRDPFKLPDNLFHANFDRKSAGLGSINNAVDASLNWDRDIGWLRSITKLPIVAKGILTAEDAQLALKAGVDAIGVSNHGGRQLDTVPATVEALPEIARVAKGRVPIIFDGGVRKGTDVFKALALGADFVCVGRPSLYALAWDGEEGVRKMLGFLNEELRLAMVLAGTVDVKSITRAYVAHESTYWKL